MVAGEPIGLLEITQVTDNLGIAEVTKVHSEAHEKQSKVIVKGLNIRRKNKDENLPYLKEVEH